MEERRKRKMYERVVRFLDPETLAAQYLKPEDQVGTGWVGGSRSPGGAIVQPHWDHATLWGAMRPRWLPSDWRLAHMCAYVHTVHVGDQGEGLPREVPAGRHRPCRGG